MSQIRVLLADEHTVVRAGLMHILQKEPDIVVVSQASDGREALALAEKHTPHVVLMEALMPNLSGIGAAVALNKRGNPPHIIILSACTDLRVVKHLLDIGISGYLVKQCQPADLVRAIRTVHRGSRFFSDAVRRIVEGHLTPNASDRHVQYGQKLTPRELEVVQFIAEGKGNKEMAAELGLSVKTVEKHRQQAMNKLNLHNIAELTKFAIAHGLTTAPPVVSYAFASP